MNELVQLLDYDFMRRALLAAALVGVTTPLVGAFLVQRGLSLVGDGLGHVALAGVAGGVLTGTAPVWTALVTAVGAALLIEAVRARGRTSGDVALAVIFYGGIAGGVVLMSVAPAGTTTNLDSYLFGAITTTSGRDVQVFAVLAAVVVTVIIVLRPWLFAVAVDEGHARAVGLHTRALTSTLAVLTAVTVVLSMRTVGLRLISALMVLPVAAAQRMCRSFTTAIVTAALIGLGSSVGGVTLSAVIDTPSGGTIVLLALAVFALAAVGTSRPRRRATAQAVDAHLDGLGRGLEPVPHGRVSADPPARATPS